MRFKTEASEFKKGITFISKFVDSGVHIPVLECIKLYANPDKNHVLSVGSDLEFWGSNTVEADVEAGGKICVPADKLKKVLSNISGEIEVHQSGSKLNIESEYGSYDLVTQSSADYPQFPDVPDKKGVNLPDLKEVWKKIKWSIGSGSAHDFVHVGRQDSQISFTSFNGKGLSKASFPREKEFSELDAYIPSKFFKWLCKQSQGNAQCISDDTSITFHLEDSVCNSRLVANKDHKFQKWIPFNLENKAKFNRRDLLDRLKPLSAFDDYMEIEFSNETKIEATSNETGEGASYILPEEIVGERGLKFTLNIGYTIDVLKALDEDCVEFQYGGEPTIKIEENNFTYILKTL